MTVIIMMMMTLGLIDTKYLKNGDQWKVTDAVIQNYTFRRTYSYSFALIRLQVAKLGLLKQGTPEE
jgi:hypothetical protein